MITFESSSSCVHYATGPVTSGIIRPLVTLLECLSCLITVVLCSLLLSWRCGVCLPVGCSNNYIMEYSHLIPNHFLFHKKCFVVFIHIYCVGYCLIF